MRWLRLRLLLLTALAVSFAVDPAATPPAAAFPDPERERRHAAAVEAFRRGDPDLVLRELGGDEISQAPAGGYLRYLYAEALLRRGDDGMASTVAESVADQLGTTRLAPRALLLAAYAAARAGDEPRNAALLRRLLSRYPEWPQSPAALYLLGMSYEARRDLEPAAQVYRELMLLMPSSGYADGASDRLRALALDGILVRGFSVDERIARAERLLRGGVASTASDEAEALLDDTSEPAIVGRALHVIATAGGRLRRWDLAARTVELAIARSSPEARPALSLEVGRLWHRAGKRDRALAALATVPGSARVEAAEAAYLRARILEQDGRVVDAAAAYDRVVALHEGREVAGAALWRLGWLAYLRGDRPEAARRWTRLLEIPGGRILVIPATYWIGRVRGALGAPDEAERLYRRVLAEAPRGYYGLLAARRVTPETSPPKDPPIYLPPDPATALGSDPGYARVEALRRLGLVEDAVAEMEDLVLSAAGDRVKLYGLSGAYLREERYHLALRILRRHFAELAASRDTGLLRAFWHVVYPFGWQQEVTDAATRSGLDPFLVAAIVREESSFYPAARSRAGARGLMQLMPETARPMAERRGWAFAEGSLLDERAPNLEMGTAYMAAMLREFSDPRLAAAAYNAGPRRVREWWRARRGDDIEVFVEQIPFDETRLYVKKVMVSWQEYRRLYGTTGSAAAR